MPNDERHIHLTVGEILALAEIVDRERERIRILIREQPAASLENVERQAYISKLDMLRSRLMTQIG
jgi:hypothetical protein